MVAILGAPVSQRRRYAKIYSGGRDMAKAATIYRAGHAVFGGLIVLAGLTAVAGGAEMTDAQRFPDFLRSDPYRALVTRYYNEEEPGPLHAKCATLSVVSWGAPT